LPMKSVLHFQFRLGECKTLYLYSKFIPIILQAICKFG
jgi:hypothetical protein